jgi:Protein of unknown function (DUF2878)
MRGGVRRTEPSPAVVEAADPDFEGAGQRTLAWLALAVCLGLLGAACDQFHVQSELLSYPDPWLWDQAAWVPLNFAVLLTGLVLATIPLTRVAAARGVPEPNDRRLLADLVWFVGAYGLSGLVAPDYPGALAVAYVAVWVPRIALRDERAFLYPFCIALALAGCLVEGAESELGWFSYADPDVIGVPLWLAGIYLHGAPLAFGVARRVDEAGLSPR